MISQSIEHLINQGLVIWLLHGQCNCPQSITFDIGQITCLKVAQLLSIIELPVPYQGQAYCRLHGPIVGESLPLDCPY